MNIQKSEEIVEYMKKCYSHFQQMSYFYDFDTYKILDYVALSNDLREAQPVVFGSLQETMLVQKVKDMPQIK